jgi:hypothetical protein
MKNYAVSPSANREFNSGRATARGVKNKAFKQLIMAALLCGLLAVPGRADEDVPHAPFAQWADTPDYGQFVATLFYDRSEAYHMWWGPHNTFQDITLNRNGEFYGNDTQQGYLTMQYGLADKWAFDISLGVATSAWRYFTDNGQPQSTTGIMDIPLGVRYQIFNEQTASSPWIPTLTFRAGGILPGTYTQGFAFSPGDRSAGIEAEILARKHFGWPGFGAYGDALYRWNHTTHNDHYIVSAGFLQNIKNWELDAGIRRLGSPNGENITVTPTGNGLATISYPLYLRENSSSVEAGFSYTTPKRKIKLGFYTQDVFDGANTDAKWWLGGYVTVPIPGRYKIDWSGF